MTDTKRSFVPAAGKHWRLPFYDLMAKALGADGARAVLAEQAAIRPGERVLEIGCGTGSLLLLLAKAQPAATVIGLDPDPAALAIARRKARRAGVALQLDEGFADEMPYESGSIHHVLSSFMFHHLPRDVKPKALAEVRRVLEPGGRFHMVDFGGPGSSGRGFIARHIHSHQHLKDNEEGRVRPTCATPGWRTRRSRPAAPRTWGAWSTTSHPLPRRVIRRADGARPVRRQAQPPAGARGRSACERRRRMRMEWRRETREMRRRASSRARFLRGTRPLQIPATCCAGPGVASAGAPHPPASHCRPPARRSSNHPEDAADDDPVPARGPAVVSVGARR
jgi:ubiquinone/menaquinone biosynthesis C-methylase UbiE